MGRRRRFPSAGFLFFVSMVLIAALMVVGAFTLSRRQCSVVGEVANVEVRWDMLAGCFVEHEGQFIPYDRWIHVTRGGQ